MMGKLTVFNFITLNGFYKGTAGDISWHRHGVEEGEFSAEGLKTGNILLFGRTTYEMMAGFWPTETALENFSKVALGMNQADKIVFSKTLAKADWENTQIISMNITEEICRIKQASDKNMTILGSGSIVAQFAEAGLIDEYHLMVDPVAMGEGTPIFGNIKQKLALQLTGTRTFESGAVLLSYQPK